jgi:HK97 family phage major capsid protein
MDETKAAKPTDTDYILPDDKAFPVMAPKDVKDAVASWGRYKGKASFTSFKRRLMALCRRKGEAFTAALPDSWKPAEKAVNIGENVETVRKAFYHAFMPPAAYESSMPSAWWSLDESDIWDEYVIGCKREQDSETYWHIGYTVDGDAVTFAPSTDWQQVEEVWQEVAGEQPATMSADTPSLPHAVKVLSETDTTVRLGGHGVVFGGEDLTKEHFTKACDFWLDRWPGSRPILYDHSMNKTLDLTVLGNTAKVQPDDTGIWLEMELEKSKRYQEMIKPLVDAGKLGLSSGAVSHLVRRDGKGGISVWPIVEFSLTTTPAEPRTLGVQELRSLAEYAPSVKAVLPQADAEASAAAATEVAETATNQKTVAEVTEMDEKQVQELVAQSIAAAAPQIAEAAAKAVLEKIPAPGPGVQITNVHDLEAEHGFKSIEEQLRAVRTATLQPTMTDKRLLALNEMAVKATGLSEGVPSEGGYLVQPQYSARWLENAYTTGAILSRVQRSPVTGNSMVLNGLDETSRADGSRFGGVTSYWDGEAASMTGTKPKFKKIQLNLKKVYVMYYATNEQLEDTPNLASKVDQYMNQELRFRAEDACVNGDGATRPQGILNAPALVTVAKETGQAADTIVYENVLKMWSRMAGSSRGTAIWLYNQDAEPQLYTMKVNIGTGGQAVFMPAGGASVAPYATLFNRPMVPVEYCQTVGDLGDIILADWSQYETIDKGQIQAAASIHVAFLTDESCFRFTYRIDGQSAWKSAITPAHGSNTQSPFVALAARA